MRESLLSAASPLWADLLRGMQHDIYHLPGYAALCGRIEGGESHAFVASEGNDTLLVPLIIRQVPSRLCGGQNICDATVPYGYPGPLVSGDCGMRGAGGSFLDRALDALMSSLQTRGVVSAFLRLHPLLPLDTRGFATVRLRGSVRRNCRDRSDAPRRRALAAAAIEPSS